jgi:hypothetical protein
MQEYRLKASSSITASPYHENVADDNHVGAHNNRRKEGHGNELHSWSFDINNTYFAVSSVITYIRCAFMGFLSL